MCFAKRTSSLHRRVYGGVRTRSACDAYNRARPGTAGQTSKSIDSNAKSYVEIEPILAYGYTSLTQKALKNDAYGYASKNSQSGEKFQKTKVFQQFHHMTTFVVVALLNLAGWLARPTVEGEVEGEVGER